MEKRRRTGEGKRKENVCIVSYEVSDVSLHVSLFVCEREIAILLEILEHLLRGAGHRGGLVPDVRAAQWVPRGAGAVVRDVGHVHLVVEQLHEQLVVLGLRDAAGHPADACGQ